METALSVSDLHVSFGSQQVLKGLSFTVHSGEVFALLGSNGSGKTTTINVLTTLLKPHRGSVHVLGHDVSSEARAVTSLISVTGQSASVDNDLTGRENLELLGRLRGLSRTQARTRAGELGEQFSLTEAMNRRVSTYSGGMRRRLDLAASVVRVPRVLFLDEPTTGLDPRSRRELWEHVQSLAAQGTTVFLTTQYLDEADELATSVAVLHEGSIVASGSPAQLKAAIGGHRLLQLDPDGTERRSVTVEPTTSGLRQGLDLLPNDGSMLALRAPTLDDVFLQFTQAREAAS